MRRQNDVQSCSGTNKLTLGQETVGTIVLAEASSGADYAANSTLGCPNTRERFTPRADDFVATATQA